MNARQSLQRGARLHITHDNGPLRHYVYLGTLIFYR
jgi:hypothetical protein